MKRFLKILPLLFLLSTALFTEQLQACGLNPTARIVTTPNTLTIYSGDQLQFSGTTSTPGCGSINQYRWQVDGVTKSWSSSYTHTFTLAAGVVEQVFTVQLRVRNTYNKYGYKTIYITVRDNQSLYYITDHLGSVRVTVDEDGEAVTWDDYYPYGKRMAQRTQNIGDDNDDTKYTGYQYEDEGDLNLYHAGARLYDPEIGRFLSRDRFDAKYPSFTPYQYAANNPIKFVDVNGDSIWFSFTRNEQGDLTGITVNVEGKVLNFSDSNIDTDQAAADIASYIESKFTGNIDGISISTEVNLESADNMTEVDKSDHLFVIADMNKPNFSMFPPRGGVNAIGGKVAFINSSLFKGPWDSTIGKGAERTAAHEFGHMLGWEHTEGFSSLANIMRSGGWGSNLDSSQMGSIRAKEVMPKKFWRLNLGRNSSFHGHRPNTGQQRGIIKF